MVLMDKNTVERHLRNVPSFATVFKTTRAITPEFGPAVRKGTKLYNLGGFPNLFRSSISGAKAGYGHGRMITLTDADLSALAFVEYERI